MDEDDFLEEESDLAESREDDDFEDDMLTSGDDAFIDEGPDDEDEDEDL